MTIAGPMHARSVVGLPVTNPDGSLTFQNGAEGVSSTAQWTRTSGGVADLGFFSSFIHPGSVRASLYTCPLYFVRSILFIIIRVSYTNHEYVDKQAPTYCIILSGVGTAAG